MRVMADMLAEADKLWEWPEERNLSSYYVKNRVTVEPPAPIPEPLLLSRKTVDENAEPARTNHQVCPIIIY